MDQPRAASPDPTAPVTGSGSVRFDRAAEYYDRTRAVDPAALARIVDVLRADLEGRGPVLEIGVGTGVLALPLIERRIPVVGLDLSRPMLDKIVEKAGGRAPMPLVEADATALPFADGVFGAAYLRWVLHLIPGWRGALAELVRSVRPGGVIVIEPGGYTGVWRDVWLRFREVVGDATRPAGLDMADPEDQLDGAMAAFGARRRLLPEVLVPERATFDEFFDGVARRQYSWTWHVPDEELRAAIAEVRPWVIERVGRTGTEPAGNRSPMIWRAYDLPA